MAALNRSLIGGGSTEILPPVDEATAARRLNPEAAGEAAGWRLTVEQDVAITGAQLQRAAGAPVRCALTFSCIVNAVRVRFGAH